jgi:hypothetical protein
VPVSNNLRAVEPSDRYRLCDTLTGSPYIGLVENN